MLCMSVAGVSLVACQHDVVGPPPTPLVIPVALSPAPAARWTSGAGQYDAPSSISGSAGGVSAHDGSADTVRLSGKYTYRTIVQAQFTGTISRTWNIAGQAPVPDYGPAGPGGDGNGGIVLSGIGGGYISSPQGNVSTVSMYMALRGELIISRSGLSQPTHENSPCGPQSSQPSFDCFTYSGTAGSVTLQAVEVALAGTADRSAVTTGDIAKFDVGPSPVDVGGFSVSTDELEWQWVDVTPGS